MPTIYISSESYERLKKFSEKILLPKSHVVEWFIKVLLDEDGNPIDESLLEAIEVYKLDKWFEIKEVAEYLNISSDILLRRLHFECKRQGIDKEKLLRQVGKTRKYIIPYYLMKDVIKELVDNPDKVLEEIYNKKEIGHDNIQTVK